VVYAGLHTLGEGAILAGLVLGAIVAFIIDKRFVHAAIFGAAGAVLTFVGLIHAEKVQWNANGQVALGYVFLALVCAVFALGKHPPREPDADEIELDRLHGGATPAGGDTEPTGRDALGSDAIPAPRSERSAVAP
jgi:AGZA family xanthine/uracil permease-like MFS transporter